MPDPAAFAHHPPHQATAYGPPPPPQQAAAEAAPGKFGVDSAKADDPICPRRV